MAMELTSRQLKDALVSWCMEVWKASGTPIASQQQAFPRSFEIHFRLPEDLDKDEPQIDPVILYTGEGYLEVTYDENPSVTGELLERRQKLDQFILDHPEISAEIDPLLDADILALPLVDPQKASELELMDRDEKVLRPLP